MPERKSFAKGRGGFLADCQKEIFCYTENRTYRCPVFPCTIKAREKEGPNHENRPAHRHSVDFAAAGYGHRAGACGAVRGVAPHDRPGSGGALPGRDSDRHAAGRKRRHLHSRELQAGPHAAHGRGDAGHSGGPAQPRQRQRHEPLRPAHGKARGRVVGFFGRRPVRADRPLRVVPRFACAEDRTDPQRDRRRPPDPLHVLRAGRRDRAHRGAVLPDFPLVELVRLGLLRKARGFPPVQAEPHGRPACDGRDVREAARAAAGPAQ